MDSDSIARNELKSKAAAVSDAGQYDASRLGKIGSTAMLAAARNGTGRPNGLAQHPAASAKSDPKSDRSDKPVIYLDNVHLDVLSGKCLQALTFWNEPPQLFSRAGIAVKIKADETGRKVIAPITADFLRHCLAQAAKFRRASGKEGSEAADPPIKVVNDLLSRVEHWDLPPLIAVSELPFLRGDGSIVLDSGYDRPTGMVYDPSGDLDIPTIPRHPTRGDAIQAAALIEDAIGEFPWADENASRANAYAALLTPIVRPIMHGCVPITLVDAPKQGNGKGLFVEVLSLIATGSPAAMRVAPRRDADEWRKALTSIILAGNQLCIFDNLEDVLKSPDLAAAVTSGVWQDRILGQTQDVTIPHRTVFVVTGNNLSLGGDIPRRSYWIRLDAKLSRPWLERTFTHPDLKAYVSGRRGVLVCALLTMARAWFAAKQPRAETPILGSFEDWSATIGGILAYAGIDGFLGNLSDLYEQVDQSEAQWERFLTALRAEFSDAEFTVSDLYGRMWAPIFKTLGGPLADALPDELSEPKGDIRKVMGKALRRKMGARFGDAGLYLERIGEDRLGAKWKVRASC